MAFVVETGTGLPNSNSYYSIVDFKSYHLDRDQSIIDPDTNGDYSDVKIQGALVVASDFIDTKFKFVGLRTLTTQNMEWPRVSAFYFDGRAALAVPVEVEECIAELALRQLANPHIAPDPQYDPSLTPLESSREKVGPIEEEKKYRSGGAPINFKAYPFAEKRLKELVTSGRIVERA